MRRLFLVVFVLVAVSCLVEPGWAARMAPRDADPASCSPEPSGASTAGQGQGAELVRQVRDLIKAGKYQEALPLAQRLLNIRKQKLGPQDPRVAASLQSVANIHMNLNQFVRALPLYQEALQIREQALGPEHPDTADTLARLGRTYTAMGSYAQALPVLERSLRIREKALGPEHPDTAMSLSFLAELKRQMGGHAEALPLAQQALKIREKTLGPEDPRTANSLDLLAQIYQQQGATDKALPLAEKALQIKEKALGPTHPETAASHRMLGVLHQNRQDYTQAEAAFTKGQVGKKGAGGMAETYLATGRYAQSLEVLEASAPKPYSRPQFRAQYYTQKGEVLQGLGRREEAAAAFLEAIRVIEELRARTPGERTSFFQAGMIKGYFQTYLAMIGLLAEMVQKGEALLSALRPYGPDPAAAAFFFGESIKGRSLLEAVAIKARGGPGQEVPADLAAQERQILDKARDLEAKREQILTPHRHLGRDAAAFEAELAALQKSQQDLVKELRRRLPRYAALYYPQPYNVQELPLKPGEILLEYTLGNKESYLFRVEPGGRTQVFRLALGREALEKRLGGMLAPFRQSTLRREDLNRFAVTDAAALYRELLAPALEGVAPGTHLIIVPDGALGAFPFEALVVTAGPDWGKSALVGDRWPVTYSQSAAILALNRVLGASRAPQPLFALGDCIYEKDSPRYLAYQGGQAKAGEIKHAWPEKALTMAATGSQWGRLQFPPLPETRQTVTNLANLFQVQPQAPQVLLDVLATETRLHQANLSQYRYFFFGTHGFLADKLAGVQEPTLVLTQVENKSPDDGFLTFSKVLQLKLDADLVTLAACMTGVGQVMQGEGVLNFARAFQQAGARSVMVALWNIPVNESLLFYQTFYQNLKQGQSKLQALKAARQAVRAKEAHPYFWSGLILHGEG